MGRQRESHIVSSGLCARIRPRLEELLEAYRYAEDVGRDVWDFAVEIRSLRDAGLTRSDLRWLVCKGLMAHRVELRRPHERERKFREAGELKLDKRSCFVLTPAGAAFADEQDAPSAEEVQPARSRSHTQNGDEHPKDIVPEWDPERHELRVGGKLVKQFKLPSPNQEKILAAFQEEGWPPRIDDPLPVKDDLDPRERLQNTLKALNRNQKQRLLKIKGDGTGQGVIWEVVQDGKST
jgi:hypothetical protein